MVLLETFNLVKKYSGRVVVDGVSITIDQQSIVGLLGRNGAGKTTTFRMIMGMVTPNGGQVMFEGQDITRLPILKCLLTMTMVRKMKNTLIKMVKSLTHYPCLS